MQNNAIAEAQAQGRPTWPYEPLYQFLHLNLPAYRHPSGILNVEGLAGAMGIVDETIYKWLRSGNLPAKRVRQLHDVILGAINREALAEAGVQAPEIQELYDFCR